MKVKYHCRPRATNSAEDRAIVVTNDIDQKQTHKSLRKSMQAVKRLRLLGSNFIFQHDSDSKHASKLCKDNLQHLEADRSIKVMQWPPRAPIELFWTELDRKVRKIVLTAETGL
ncbi:hypothetical protein Trydic_g16257 [Trypoxylus dichotomus]